MNWRSRVSQLRWISNPRAGLVLTLAAYAALTATIAPFFDDAELLNVSLGYLLLTLLVSAAWGYASGIIGAVVADLLVNFFFVPPIHTFTVQEPANVLGLFIFLASGLVGASMLALLRRQVQITEARRAETAAVLSLSQEIAHAVSPRDALDRLCASVVRSLHTRGCAVVWKGPRWEVLGSSGGMATLGREEEALAEEAVRSGDVIRDRTGAAGRLPRLPRVAAQGQLTLVPFGAAAPENGVLYVVGTITAPRLAEANRLLRAFADEASMAVHRFRLASDASRVQALERADEFKSAILSSVSHDLRSPLTAIKAAVESLRDDGIVWSQHDRASFLETIESQADRLTATVTKLLDMSRLEGRAVRATFEPVEVLPLLGEARAAAAPASAGRTIEIEAPEGLWLRADYHLLLQALGNLIENAARYSNPGGTIRMEGSREGERIRLTVADRGPGIPPADLPHIFEKFYRGAKNENSKGTGLGLAIVKAMVELCEGTIEVGSGSGGARFSIDLPAARAPLR